MILRCNQCGYQMSEMANFCSACGASAPQVTRLHSTQQRQDEPPILKPLHCPSCCEMNETGHLYCRACGASLFNIPIKSRPYCPICGKQNDSDAKLCYHCGESFEQWKRLTGETARKVGYQGPLKIKEKMTDQNYIVPSENVITIGRSQQNTVKIPCNFISKNHCELNFFTGKLHDLESSNGSYIPEAGKISSYPLPLVQEFNLSGLFTFRLIQMPSATLLYLAHILEWTDVLKNLPPNTSPEYFNTLKKAVWIIAQADFQLHIRKVDGRIVQQIVPGEDYYSLIKQEGFFYVHTGAKGKGPEKKLILKRFNEFWLPPNWQVDMTEAHG